MPLPKPKKGESQDEFISRCMENDVMKDEYPDNKQRLAVCFTQWKNKDSTDPTNEERQDEKYIRIRVRDPDDFVKDSFKTITLSEDQGIHSVIGKLKSDPDGSTHVQNYMFEIAKGWNESKAKKWVEEHKKSSDMQIERRFYPFSEIRVDDQKEPKLVGYAAVFDALSEVMWGMREKIQKGAFEKTIEKDDIRMLWNHDPNFVLARNKAGTLTLKEDDKGLYFEAIPPDTQWAKDLLVTIKRGDVTQNSFGFIILDDDWDENEDGMKIRTLKKVKLFDVSPVTYPAYPQTELHIRGRWGEMTLVYDELKDGTKTTIANIIRANEKVKVRELSHRYAISDNLYSATEPNPTIFSVNSTDKAKASFVEAKPNKPLIDPVRWARYSKYL
jgi:hypothetical protein